MLDAISRAFKAVLHAFQMQTEKTLLLCEFAQLRIAVNAVHA